MFRSPVRALLLLAVLAAPGRAAAQALNPDFVTVSWTPLGCPASPLTAAAPRGEVDLVGDASSPAAWVGLDATFIYFRYRVNGDPSGRHGFASSSDWSMLVHVPSGNPFQYQYQLALSGDGQGGDGVEVWENTTPEDLSFAPLFTDEPETQIFRQHFEAPGTVNTTPLARFYAVSGVSDTTDYFIEVAFALADLAAAGVPVAELGSALFWPATGTLPTRHNRDELNCPFLPPTTLAVDASVSPARVSPNASTHVIYTIAVHDTGAVDAVGVTLAAPALPAWLQNVVVTASDGTVVSTVPLEVQVPTVAAGATVTVQIDADAAPTCTDTGVTTTFLGAATNALGANAPATLDLDTSPAAEICDGVDNNCDGQIDEGGNALCDDGNACTTDVCDGIGGCGHIAIPGCVPCTTVAECQDDMPCTMDSCTAGQCIHDPIDPCIPCTMAADCGDGDPCTDDACGPEGVCVWIRRPGCVPCTSRGDCDDANACTVDQCAVDSTCTHEDIPGCRPCATAADCDDGRRCTTDVCAAGACAYTDVPGCVECTPAPEVCDNGTDDDCDGLVDCADPDCAAAPACVPKPVEICDNCVDDDGDGLVDWEDPDCCAAPRALSVAKLSVKPASARAHGNQLRIDAVYSGVTPALFDPQAQETTILLLDRAGSLLCATIPPERWRRPHRLAFRFTDRAGAVADGIDAADFRITRSGTLLFRARGRDVGSRPLDGASVRVLIRVGKECTQSALALRTARKGLVFP